MSDPDGLRTLRLDPRRAALLLIDVQPDFIDKMVGSAEAYLRRLEQVLVFSQAFSIPLIATLEHPAKDPTAVRLPPPLHRVIPPQATLVMKCVFNFCEEPEFDEAFKSRLPEAHRQRPQMVVCGGETDVCVLQTVLGLLEKGLEVFVLEDCLYTSEPNPGPALQRMYQSGAMPTTYKIFYHEVTRVVGRGPQVAKDFNASHPDLPPLVDPESLCGV